MMVRRLLMLIVAMFVLWKCLMILLSQLAMDDIPPTAAERALPEHAPAAARDSITLQHRPTAATNRRVLRGQILLALQEQQVALDPCALVAGTDKTFVSLELELLDGAARIADVDLITEGTPDPALVACLQTALRDRILPASNAKPTAKRSRVVFRLDDYR